MSDVVPVRRAARRATTWWWRRCCTWCRPRRPRPAERVRRRRRAPGHDVLLRHRRRERPRVAGRLPGGAARAARHPRSRSSGRCWTTTRCVLDDGSTGHPVDRPDRRHRTGHRDPRDLQDRQLQAGRPAVTRRARPAAGSATYVSTRLGPEGLEPLLGRAARGRPAWTASCPAELRGRVELTIRSRRRAGVLVPGQPDRRRGRPRRAGRRRRARALLVATATPAATGCRAPRWPCSRATSDDRPGAARVVGSTRDGTAASSTGGSSAASSSTWGAASTPASTSRGTPRPTSTASAATSRSWSTSSA